jgi:hypothetical protein
VWRQLLERVAFGMLRAALFTLEAEHCFFDDSHGSIGFMRLELQLIIRLFAGCHGEGNGLPRSTSFNSDAGGSLSELR